ncbi:MAG: VCBS repeat-containing protein [Ignavibacteria bacterium]|nr:VCBS repeat-containing protein [Ignavibacteria bacterium]
MKKIIPLLFILCFLSASYSQMFQKISNQPLVTEQGFGSGCAWGDYNNDGKLDMIVTSYNDFGATTYPLLYKNMGNGNFQLAGDNTIMTNSLYQTLACAWGDYNYDGRMDLYIATGLNQPDLLYKNMGGGNFTRITNCVPLVNGHSGGVNWTDYNKDGYLDILSVQHGTNLLYKGLPNGDYQQVTTGPIVTDNGLHRRAVWGDYNNDKYPDLFVANGDFQNDNLYLNNKNGTFTKITTGPVVTSGGYGSGCAWGDYNNDGWLDLFVANSGMNFLYKNNQNGTFTKITSGAIANDEDNSFGCNWGDYDNDGDLDMFVANNYGQKNALYRNDGNDNFTRMNSEAVSTDNSSSVGSAWGDYNNDGKLDLFVVNQGSGPQSENDYLFKNTGASNWYLMLKFWGGGIGTRVKIRIGSYVAIREVSGGNGCSSQDMPWIHFGLGFLADNPVSAADSVIVDWHDGTTEILTNVPLNQELDFFGVVPVQQISSEVPTVYSLEQNYPNPFNPVTNINYSIVTGGEVRVTLFDISGKEVDVLVDGIQSPGKYSISYNASRLPSGVYFYRIQTDGFADTKKMILVK